MKKQRLLNLIEIVILVIALSTIGFYIYKKIYANNSIIKTEGQSSNSNAASPKRTTPPEKPNPGGI